MICTNQDISLILEALFSLTIKIIKSRLICVLKTMVNFEIFRMITNSLDTSNFLPRVELREGRKGTWMTSGRKG